MPVPPCEGPTCPSIPATSPPLSILHAKFSSRMNYVYLDFQAMTRISCRGSTPLTRTLQLSPMMGQEECHAAEKALQRGVQA